MFGFIGVKNNSLEDLDISVFQLHVLLQSFTVLIGFKLSQQCKVLVVIESASTKETQKRFKIMKKCK